MCGTPRKLGVSGNAVTGKLYRLRPTDPRARPRPREKPAKPQAVQRGPRGTMPAQPIAAGTLLDYHHRPADSQARRDTCRYPSGDYRKQTLKFWGLPVANEGASYCLGHLARCTARPWAQKLFRQKLKHVDE